MQHKPKKGGLMMTNKRFALLTGQPVSAISARVPAGKTKGVYLPTFLINHVEDEVKIGRAHV